MDHHCHARRCTTVCKPELLMCPAHWKMVPRVLQDRVYKEYVPGQCQLTPPPTEAWHLAADAAIDYVDKAETAGLTVTMILAIQALGAGSGILDRNGTSWAVLAPDEGYFNHERVHEWFGTVTVNRLKEKGFIEVSFGRAKITNAAIAFYAGKE